jgi:hypothetical protein
MPQIIGGRLIEEDHAMTELRNDRSAYGALETSVSLSDAQIEERARDLLRR